MTANTRIIVTRRQDEADSLGQPIEAWVEVGRYWADVRFLSGLSAIRADASTSLVRASARIRVGADVQIGDRLTTTGGTWTLEVEAALPELKSRAHIDFACKGVS